MSYRGRFSRQPYSRTAGGVRTEEIYSEDNLAVAISESALKTQVIPEVKQYSDDLAVAISEISFASTIREPEPQFYIFDHEMKQLLTLSWRLLINPEVIQDYHIGENTLIFRYPADQTEVESLEVGNTVIIRDIDNNAVPYLIRKTNIDENIIRVECDHLYYELADARIATYGIGNLLDFTRWEYGEIEEGIISATSGFYMTFVNPLEYIRGLETEYDIRATFRIGLNNLGIATYLLDLSWIDEEFKGQRFEFGWNLQSVDITTDYSGLKTALVGTAMSGEVDAEGEPVPMTFEDVEWSVAGGDPVDKPLGQDWVGDDTARTNYGIYDSGTKSHRFGLHESTADTPEQLLTWTWVVLQRKNKPKINIESTVADLEKTRIYDILTGESLKLDHEKIRLGNICRVVARHKNITVAQEARIIRIVRALKNPEATVIELGDYRDATSDRFRHIIQRVTESEVKTVKASATSKDYADYILQLLADGTYPYEGTFIDETKIYSPEIISPLVIGLQGFFDELIAGSDTDYMHLLAEMDKPYINFYDDSVLRMRQTSDRMQYYTSAGNYGGMLIGEEDDTYSLPAISMISPFMSRMLSVDNVYGLERSTGIATRVHSGDLGLYPEMQLYTLDITDRVDDTGTATSGGNDTLTDTAKTWEEIQDTGTATSGGNTTLTDTAKTWDDTDDGEYEGYYLKIVAGTGADQVRAIASNTVDTLTVSSAWDTNPDNTSEYQIYIYDDKYAGYYIRITAGTGIDQERIVDSNTEDTITVTAVWDTNPDATSEYEIYEPSNLVTSITMGGNVISMNGFTAINNVNPSVPSRSYIFMKNGANGTGIINFVCE